MKLGKELKLDLLKNYKTKLGTVNNKESKSIYINLTAWGEIKNHDENINYDFILNNLRKKIKQNLNNNIEKEVLCRVRSHYSKKKVYLLINQT
jgi:hypothetical protein